jgi:ATP-dependent helicase/nuclease subunit A
MANRLHRDLASWVILDDSGLQQALLGLTGRAATEAEMELARRLFAQVLDSPGGLKIQTIHAFCESLLSRFPLESNIPPHFSVIDERTSMELLNEARDQVLTQARVDRQLVESLQHLTAQVSEDRFREVAHELTTERGRLENLFGRFDGSWAALSTAIEDLLGLQSGEDESSIMAAACGLPDAAAQELHQVAEAMMLGGKTDQRHGKVIADWIDNDKARRDMFSAYASAFLTAQGSRRVRLIHMDALDHANDDAELVLAEEASRLEVIETRLKAAQTASDTMALLRLGYALVSAYGTEKRSRALLDYDDLITLARQLLSRPGIAPWILYKLDGGLDHILVDEAQDTNEDQWQVIAALTDEFFVGQGAREGRRTIFAVGDAKQSIYSFQHADPQLFSQWRAHFGSRVGAAGEVWRALELVHSYRSTPPILSLVDEVFRSEEARAGLVFDGVDVDHIPHRVGQAGLVQLWPADIPDDTEEPGIWEPPVFQQHEVTSGVRLAQRIAGTIADWLRRGEILESRARPIQPGDVMILVQRRAGFIDEMVRALKQQKIPVAGTDRMILTEQLPVKDLISLGRFASLPDDDLALAEVLKSPLFGLDDDDLFNIAWDRGDQSLWEVFLERCHLAPAYDAAARTLEEFRDAADRTAPYEFFAAVLGTARGRRKLAGRLGPEANDPIDEFLSLCLQYERLHAPTLEGFLHWVETAETEIKRDLELGKNEVRVLTVHGAKGLQAPIVFLPDTCRTAHDSNRIRWIQEGSGAQLFPLWPARREREGERAFKARNADKIIQEQESRRLLYVALTRAEDRLYIGGFEGTSGRPANCWYDLIAGAMRELSDSVNVDDGLAILELRSEQLQEPDKKDVLDVRAPIDMPLPSWAQRSAPVEASPPSPLVPSQPKVLEPPIRSPMGPDEGSRYRRGRLIHRLLELLPELEPVDWLETAMEFVSNAQYELDQEAKQEIVDVTLAVLNDPEFAPLFGPNSRAEVAIAGLEGEFVVSGQIDRLLVTDESVLIVDYKSDRPAPKSIEAVPLFYLKQLAVYWATLSRIYPTRSIRCALLWTDGPKLMEVSSKALSACVP